MNIENITNQLVEISDRISSKNDFCQNDSPISFEINDFVDFIIIDNDTLFVDKSGCSIEINK